jgi:hypothetical protein
MVSSIRDREPGPAVGVDEAVPGQRLTQLQRDVFGQARDLGCGLDGPAVGKHRRGLQQGPLGRIEQAHAPGHRGPQGLLPPGQIDRAGAQHVQRGGQPGQQRARVQQPDTGSRQLDGQRQAFQAAADLQDRRRVGLGQGETGPDRLGPVHEQRHRRPGHQLIGRHGGGDRPSR